ncbi:MAG: insulinase family protein [Chitinophagales bacterium]
MRLLRRVLPVFLMAIACFATAQIDTSSFGGLYFIKLPNGMSSVVYPKPGAPNVQISLHIRAGSTYETDTSSGSSNLIQSIFADRIATALRSGKQGVSLQNTAFTAWCTPEQTIFQISGPPAYTPIYLQLLGNALYNAPVLPNELEKAIEARKKENEASKTDKAKQLEEKLSRQIYRLDYYRINVTGDPAVLSKLDTQIVNTYYRKLYVPENSLFGVAGAITPVLYQDFFENAYRKVYRTDFDPEVIIRVVDFKPMLYTTQLVAEAETSQPEFQICWQFPGSNANGQLSYMAYLLSSVLNDKNNYIQAKARKLGCNFLQFQYEANSFSAIFRAIIRPSKANFFQTYHMVLTELLQLDKTLLNETMLNAGKLKFKKEYTDITQTLAYPDWVIKYWPFRSEIFFQTLPDSIMPIKENAMRKFAIEYLRESPHTTALFINAADRAELGVDSQFIELDEQINNTVFSFRPNVTELEGETNEKALKNLLQWLQINTDIQAQVNGWSDEGEYNRVKDDSIMQFIDSMPEFRKIKVDLVKKNYLRPDVVRALKVVKYLYDHGIAKERLTGTGMVFKSANRQEALSNMKVEVTLNKLRKSVSLFEYHYGVKPKE